MSTPERGTACGAGGCVRPPLESPTDSWVAQQLREATPYCKDMRIAIGRAWIFEPPKEKLLDVVHSIAFRHQRNPLGESLGGLVWDRNNRLDGWLHRGLGAADIAIHRAFGRRFCIAAVARALQPGCKVDTVLMLCGSQGVRKSTALRVLAGEDRFSDTEIDLGSKDRFMQLGGVWIYEIAEMAAFQGKRADRTKAYVSSQVDNYRPPHGHATEQVRRQTVFVATTNEEAPLTDPAGSRRFWPVFVAGPIGLAWLARNRDQLWAEAVHAYRAGEQWHLTEEEERLRRCTPGTLRTSTHGQLRSNAGPRAEVSRSRLLTA